MKFPSDKEALVLGLLIARGELYGLELVRASHGELKRGTIYVTLQRMEEKGFVSSRVEASTPDHIGLPRRQYKVTGLGEQLYRAWQMASTAVTGKGLVLA